MPFMTQEELNAILAREENGEFVGSFKYSEKRTPMAKISYSVWNPPLAGDVADEPGIVMRVNQKVGDKWETSKEKVPSVNAVILFATPARDFTKIRAGAKPEQLCHSHDGQHPSAKIDSPLCRKATASDVVQIISKFKGYDAAKIESVSHELTQGTGQLQMCGLKTANGFINICPYAKKDPVTGAKPGCKEQMYVAGYDLDRSRQFIMELTGKSIRMGETFTAPIHDFFKALRKLGPAGEDGRAKGLPCYAVKVKLAPAKDGRFYYLDVALDSHITEAEELTNMQFMAHDALDRYHKAAMRLSKEAFEASRKEKMQAKEGQGPAVPVQPTPEPPKVIQASPKKAVSFEEDDIPF